MLWKGRAWGYTVPKLSVHGLAWFLDPAVLINYSVVCNEVQDLYVLYGVLAEQNYKYFAR